MASSLQPVEQAAEPSLPWIRHLEVRGYGCIRSAAFEFGRLHALIGPNDSGKSTILRAIASLQHAATTGTQDVDLQRRAAPDGSAGLRLSPDGEVWWSVYPGTQTSGFSFPNAPGAPVLDATFMHPDLGGAGRGLAGVLSGSFLLRLDTDELRAPSLLLAAGERVRFRNERGAGLAAVLDALRDRNDRSFDAINDAVCKHFESLKHLRLDRDGASAKVIGATLKDGTNVRAHELSEGVLYFLALETLKHADLPSVVLLEEPENGLHPARIAEVMKSLREASKRTQILIATHSPLVINELDASEVTVVTRTEEGGTQGVLLKDTPNFGQRSKVYAPGELWLSYANGTDEGPLLRGSAGS